MGCPEPRIRHRCAAASRGVVCSSECCVCRCTWAIGLPRSREPMPRRFRRTVVVFHRHRSVDILRCRVHPLVSFDLLQSAIRQSSARALARPSSSLGVRFPLRGVSTRSPPVAGHPEPDDVPPAAFRTLSTACSSPCLARLFRRAAVSRVSLQGLPPPSEPYHLVGGRDPRAVGGVRLPVARRQRTTRRPQGRALVQSPQCAARLFTTPSPVSLPAFFQTPSGISQRPGPCHRTSSARGLDGAVLRVPRTVTLSVSISPVCFASVPRGCSRSSFPAFESVAQLARPISS
jgi:hypothetical protein